MYSLKTKGNQSGPEKFIQRGRKDGNGRFFTDDAQEAQTWVGFIPAKKRAEEAALRHHITIEILEDGLCVASVSPNLTLTTHTDEKIPKIGRTHIAECDCDDCLVCKLTAFKSVDDLLNAKGNYRPSLTKQNADTRRLADLYDAHQDARGDSRRAFRG